VTTVTASDLREIEDLLAEPVAAAAERERTTFAEQLRAGDGTVVLFGAGRLGQLCARALARAGVPLRAFCDGNSRLQGTTVAGVEVLAPADAARRFGGALFVVAIWTGTARESMLERVAFLRGLGCAHVTSYAPLVWAHGAEEAPFHSFDLPARTLAAAAPLRELAVRLADDASRRVFLAALRQRLRGIFDATAPAVAQYFPADIVRLSEDEVFVDGGAFDGDTLADFVGRVGERFAHYHAFEPDAANRVRLMGRLEGLPAAVREKITIHPLALHAESATLSFTDQGGPTSHVGTGGNTSVRGERLDAILAVQRLSFLKLDVEGAEPLVIMGALETIRKYKPIIFFEQTDKCVNDEMKASLSIDFDIPSSVTLLEKEGYTITNVDDNNKIAMPIRSQS
jgi:FkbM family methyltransferase